MWHLLNFCESFFPFAVKKIQLKNSRSIIQITQNVTREKNENFHFFWDFWNFWKVQSEPLHKQLDVTEAIRDWWEYWNDSQWNCSWNAKMQDLTNGMVPLFLSICGKVGCVLPMTFWSESRMVRNSHEIEKRNSLYYQQKFYRYEIPGIRWRLLRL